MDWKQQCYVKDSVTHGVGFKASLLLLNAKWCVADEDGKFLIDKNIWNLWRTGGYWKEGV